MKTRSMTQARLKELLDYDSSEGIFRWKSPQSNRVKIGAEAGSVASNGRRYISLDGVPHMAHRLAWLYEYGVWSDKSISANDGDYLNLKISNYTEETFSSIARKGRHRSTGSSGIKGVSWDKSKNRWLAYITRDYKMRHLGRYETKEEAAEAYRRAADGYGLSPVDPTARAAKAMELAIKAKQRIVWRRTQNISGGVTGWGSFAEFAKDIGSSPPQGHNVVPIDPSKPVGPGNFSWGPELAKAFDTSTREGRIAYGRAYRAANPNIFKRRHLEKTFGITLANYQELLLKQNGVCAICQKPELNVGRNGKTLSLAVDHCHVSGVVRSLLCLNCNQGIGSFRDDPELMRRAIEYIKRHAQQGSVVPIKRKVR